jgi:DNA (cytosine-5)-methyltransferase 1
MKEITNNEAVVVDLFCGIGGLTHGFKKEGFDIAGGFDIDITCKYAFEANNDSTFYLRDLASVSATEVNALFQNASIKILVGCAPCQPFSSYTYKDKVKDSSKWSLLYEFSRIINETKPDIISMENVPNLLNFKKAPVFEEFIKNLKTQGYNISHQIINCPDYGIPQKRKRLVLLASKFGDIELIPKTHDPQNYVTVKDAIGNLPKIKDGQSDKNDPLHLARKLSLINKKRIIKTPYGGSWKDWPKDLILKCHKKRSGKTYSSVYGRMIWEEPSPTITTHCVGYGNGRFGHPEQDRAISLREAAILQTFPIEYKFYENSAKFSSVRIAKQLGNAVPVRLGEIIAKSIKLHLKKIK